jgi:hypothetical protein
VLYLSIFTKHRSIAPAQINGDGARKIFNSIVEHRIRKKSYF